MLILLLALSTPMTVLANQRQDTNTFNASGPFSRGQVWVGGTWVVDTPARPAVAGQPARPAVAGQPARVATFRTVNGRRAGVTPARPPIAAQPAQPAILAQPARPAVAGQPVRPAVLAQPAQPATWRVEGGTPAHILYPDALIMPASMTTGPTPIGTVVVREAVNPPETRRMSPNINQAGTEGTRPALQWNIRRANDPDWNPGPRDGKPLSVTHRQLQEIRVDEEQQITVPITRTVTVGNWHVAEQETRITYNTFYVSGPNNGRIMVGGSWVYTGRGFVPERAEVPFIAAQAATYGMVDGRWQQITAAVQGQAFVPFIPAQPAIPGVWIVSGGTPVRDLYRDPRYSVSFVSGGSPPTPIGTARVIETIITVSSTGREDSRWSTQSAAASAASSRGRVSTNLPAQTSVQHFITRSEVNADDGRQTNFNATHQGPFATAQPVPATRNVPGGETTEYRLMRTDTNRLVQLFSTGVLVRGTTTATTERARVLAQAQQAQRDFRLPPRWRLIQERSTDNGRTWTATGTRQPNTHETLRQAQATIPSPNPARTAGNARWFIREGRLGQARSNILSLAEVTFSPTGKQEGPFESEAMARAATATHPARHEQRQTGRSVTRFLAADSMVFSLEGGRGIDRHATEFISSRLFSTRADAEDYARDQIGGTLFSRASRPAGAEALAAAESRALFGGTPLPPSANLNNSVEFQGSPNITGSAVFSTQRNLQGQNHRSRTLVWGVWPVSVPTISLDTYVWRPFSTGTTTLTRWQPRSEPVTPPPTVILVSTRTTPNMRFVYGRGQNTVSSPAGERTITWVPINRSYTELRQDTQIVTRTVQVTRPEEITVTSVVRVGSRLVK